MIRSRRRVCGRGLFIVLLFALLAGLLASFALSAGAARKWVPEIITADRFEGRIKAL